MLQVKLLGQFQVLADGRKVVIPSRAGQSLFAYLLLTAGTLHRREKLAGLFWPETSDDNARHSLRHELWRVRKAISGPTPAGVDYLLSEELGVTFNPKADYWLDAVQLESAISAEESSTELLSRLGLYQGELLPGFYDDWVVMERERFQALFETRMQQLMKLLIQEQRWPTVLEWGERWISLGQTPEPAYRALMLAYATLGDRAQALAAFRRCAVALEKEFGVEPALETRALYEDILKTEGGGLPREGFAPLPASVPHVQLSSLILQASDAPPAPGDPPFKGLQYFDEGDADLFFGREQLTAKLLERLRENRFLAVIVGASGSGKSSIVRAGLVHACKKEPDDNKWRIYLLTPTAHPLEALAVALTRDAESLTATATLMDDLAQDPRSLYFYLKRKAEDRRPIADDPRASAAQRRILLVVDQFEELFTLCRDELEREQFVDNLLTAIAPEGGRPVMLVLSIRADFYPHLAQYPELRELVAQNQEYIGPMTAEELRRAIEEPAKRGGWEFEPGLVDLMLRDVGDEPGGLPLLSHALLETWKRRRGRRMTLQGYHDAGGVRGAIAQTAETVYRGLAPEGQTIARNIFLRLTELGEGTEDTRRRASVDELITNTEMAGAVRTVLNQLVEARLVTTGEAWVEVAHEALIREWPTLREWLAQDREGLRLHRHLTEAANDWGLLERDASALYRGARLAQACEFAQASPNALNEQERSFLEASEEQDRREQKEKQEQQQRELDSAKRIAETARRLEEEQRRRAEEQSRAAKSLRRRAYFLASAFVLAIALAAVTLFFGQEARSSASAAQANASLAEKAKGEADVQRLAAESERRTAISRELAAVAISNLNADPQQSLLLALEAVSVTYSVDKTWTTEAENALHQAVQAVRVPLTFRGHKENVLSAVFSPDGKHIASTGHDATKVWDASTGKELLSLPGAWPYFTDAFDRPAGFSPDGLRLASLDASDTQTSSANIWDLTSGNLVHAISLPISPGAITDSAFSSDLTRLATRETDGNSKIWDLTDGQLLQSIFSGCTSFCSIALSSDETRLATGRSGDVVKIWDVSSGKQVGQLAPATSVGRQAQVNHIAFSPDGMHLAASYTDGTARVWDWATGQELVTLVGHTNQVGPITFSPDGKRIASGSLDTRAIVWDASNGRELFTLTGHSNYVSSVAFSPDGQRLVTASDDGTVKVWNLAPSGEALKVTMDPILAFAASGDGRRFATSHADNTVKVWDATTGGLVWTLSGHTAPVRGIAFSRDGTHLASASSDMTAKLWDLASGKQLLTLAGHANGVNAVAFSPDGTLLATASSDTTAKIWDAASGEQLLTLEGFAGSVNNVSFSSDGRRLATAHSNAQVKIWDAATGKFLAYQSGHASFVWDAQFSPDGKLLVSAGQDATARVIDAATIRGLFILFGHTASVTHAVFNADSTRIATTSDDGTARVWDAATGQELLTLQGHAGPVNGVAFSPDGSRLITSSEDGTVQVYLLRIQDLVQLARSRLTRAWTSAECVKFLHLEQCPPTP
jgi:WD40 repeat protein/DNA-binding SARP family transcriptional activator